ncbi:amidohydrolase family protein [Microbacterium sp.]|uniref:N-acyl-D-amino-acid deacylase family protein n=1 Tax=Microbacterium sp. TaxID=51671 RepID=UPI0033405718
MTARVRTAILSGTVVDGFGGAEFAGDVIVADGRIEAVVRRENRPADGYDAEIVDADGLVIAPGFVDVHCHSDLTRFSYPDAESRITQGITTEIVGNCGMSAAPTGGDPAGLAGVIATIDVTPDAPRPWATVAEWLEALDTAPAAANVAALVGHGSARHAAAPGRGAQLDPEELSALVDEIRAALDAGCAGVSLGLMYAPGESAGKAELSAVAEAAARGDGLLAAHLRDYDARELDASIAETAGIAGTARLQISHLRATHSDGRFADTLATVERLRIAQDVAADSYPYTAGHTTLLQLLPSEIRAMGPAAALALGTSELARLLGESGWRPEQIIVMKAAATPEAVGMTAAQHDRPWHWLAETLHANAALVDVAVESGADADVDLAMATDWIAIGSDGTALSAGHRSSAPHPRSWGTFPAAFRRMRGLGVSLPSAVRRMSVASAERAGIPSGLRAGLPADIVVFDEQEIDSRSTFADPARPAAGIRDVYVNGVAVQQHGAATGARPGRLRRKERAA